MRVRGTATARSDLFRLREFLASKDPAAAVRAVRSLRAAPASLSEFQRRGMRLDRYQTSEVRRVFIGDYELRYEVRDELLIVHNIWHTREDR